jgi:hypothetical protein
LLLDMPGIGTKDFRWVKQRLARKRLSSKRQGEHQRICRSEKGQETSSGQTEVWLRHAGHGGGDQGRESQETREIREEDRQLWRRLGVPIGNLVVDVCELSPPLRLVSEIAALEEGHDLDAMAVDIGRAKSLGL